MSNNGCLPGNVTSSCLSQDRGRTCERQDLRESQGFVRERVLKAFRKEIGGLDADLLEGVRRLRSATTKNRERAETFLIQLLASKA